MNVIAADLFSAGIETEGQRIACLQVIREGNSGALGGGRLDRNVSRCLRRLNFLRIWRNIFVHGCSDELNVVLHFSYFLFDDLLLQTPASSPPSSFLLLLSQSSCLKRRLLYLTVWAVMTLLLLLFLNLSLQADLSGFCPAVLFERSLILRQ